MWLRCPLSAKRFAFTLHRFSLKGSFDSALLGSSGILALLHAAEGDIDDGNQTLLGVQGAEQPVRISLAQDLQDIALVEAELAGLGGYVVAQRSYFTEE